MSSARGAARGLPALRGRRRHDDLDARLGHRGRRAATLYTGGAAGPTDVTITVLGTSDPAVTLDPATGLITLAPGSPAGDYTVTYEICSVLVPTVCDTATETVNQLPLPALEATKTQVFADNGDGIDGVGDTLTYTITVENTGNTPLETLTLVDTLTTLAGDPLVAHHRAELRLGERGLARRRARHRRDRDLHRELRDQRPGRDRRRACRTRSPPRRCRSSGRASSGRPRQSATCRTTASTPTGTRRTIPPSTRSGRLLPAGQIVVEKSTPRGVVERGAVVPYTITVRNQSAAAAGPLQIVDALPPGFLYVPGSATLGGVPVDVRVAGRILFWDGVTVPPSGAVTATLSARVTQGASAGEHVNRASARDPATGAALAPVATATVRILPEAVFDCGDVIGKVFDDRNGDGYQNDPGPAPIVSDDVFAGKAGPAALAETWGEPGIPAVRLAGVDGTIITTDEFGRFHVPCAMLPDDRGSNFILKVDTRSLPTGYRLTTENPRVVRLTPGKMTEMNFGATLTRVVRIDLNDRAFVAGRRRAGGAVAGACGRDRDAPAADRGRAREPAPRLPPVRRGGTRGGGPRAAAHGPRRGPHPPGMARGGPGQADDRRDRRAVGRVRGTA
jgi:uncharacterized repeat protein (TIGR01451 family)